MTSTATNGYFSLKYLCMCLKSCKTVFGQSGSLQDVFREEVLDETLLAKNSMNCSATTFKCSIHVDVVVNYHVPVDEEFSQVKEMFRRLNFRLILFLALRPLDERSLLHLFIEEKRLSAKIFCGKLFNLQ